jgi:hypothetical protein
VHPPNHLVRPDVESITLPDGSTHRFVWILPSVPPASPPRAGGVAFLPGPREPGITIVTFNVAPLGRAGHAHHAEMQLTAFVEAQPAWRERLSRIDLHMRSRTAGAWGYSPCRDCLGDLAGFLSRLNRARRGGRIVAGMSWERLCERSAACGPPTDAASIRRLVAAGWNEPMGRRPPGTRWPSVPARQRVGAP